MDFHFRTLGLVLFKPEASLAVLFRTLELVLFKPEASLADRVPALL